MSCARRSARSSESNSTWTNSQSPRRFKRLWCLSNSRVFAGVKGIGFRVSTIPGIFSRHFFSFAVLLLPIFFFLAERRVAVPPPPMAPPGTLGSASSGSVSSTVTMGIGSSIIES
ncbi:hypothetical protein V8G54_025010 [Vigna mungo]|uniref:Uncharacterized protein n=1 Tax=Vigna mungo TaxID=3915 RepID=A0AAQ3RTP8_VIGMU